mgnify:FL=1
MNGMEWTPGLPEILLAASAMILLMVGAFGSERASRPLAWLAIAVLVLVGGVLLGTAPQERSAFGGFFVTDAFAVFMKILVLVGAAGGILLSLDFNARAKIERFEYPILILFASLGMMMMISAGDLMSLYLGLELQSLTLYVIAAFHRDSARSTEAGLKYFVLGALASGLYLYGASLIYGFAGVTEFAALASTMLDAPAQVPLGALIGMAFVVAALAFKVSAAPFHMWTPDVYEGAPTPVTAFFSAAPKVAAVALLIRVLVGPFGPLVGSWQQIVWAIALLSMLIGSFAAIHQTNIKRLMAYSSIGHVGYALVGLAAGNEAGVRGVLVYMAIYLAMNLGTFAVIVAMRRGGQSVERIDDLAGLARTRPLVAATLAVGMFSMAGIPPLAGFFAKLYVFLAAVSAGLYVLAVIGVLASVVGAYYYLRIVKVMYFDEPAATLDRTLDGAVGTVLAVSTAFTLLFFMYPAPVVGWANAAALSLFAG